MKKKTICIIVAVVAVVVISNFVEVDETTTAETTTKKLVVTTTTTPPTTTEKIIAPTTTKPVDTMVQQFISLGFTETEAKKVKEVFTTVGITEINNIQAVGNAGIDNLQAFKCGIYDSRIDKGGPTLLFTVEKRQVCHMSLNGFMNRNSLDYDSVVLYDIWNEDGTINGDAVGYKAVIDYENGKITKYEG